MPVGLALLCQVSQAQTYKVESDKTITFEVAGATAAYTLESFADASAENGVVTVAGVSPGAAHVMVVTPSGIQNYVVTVTQPPLVYPKGYTPPETVQSTGEGGYSETRYLSTPSEIQNQMEFVRREGDMQTSVHLSGIDLLGSTGGTESRMTLTSAYYRIATPDFGVTLLDDYVNGSDLSVHGTLVRGLHVRVGNWFAHFGDTSVATFQNLILPTKAETVLDGGYRYQLSSTSSLTGELSYFKLPASDLSGSGGAVATATYKYHPSEGFSFTADLGASRGIGASVRVEHKSVRDKLRAFIRYAAPKFASLAVSNPRGFHADVLWARRLTEKVDVDASLYSNRMVMPGLDESVLSSNVNLNYHATKNWTFHGGAMGSSAQNNLPPSDPIRSLQMPAGLGFQSRHFGAMAEYSFSRTAKTYANNGQYRTSLRLSAHSVSFTAAAQRQTEVPTLSFVYGQAPGLQQALQLLGIQAATLQDLETLLAENSFLMTSGYITGATINVIPVRDQISGNLSWSGHGAHRPQVNYSYLLDDDHALLGTSQTTTHSVTFSERISHTNELAVSCSVLGAKTPGRPAQSAPVVSVGLRHFFSHTASLLIPHRHGTITGTVFRDDKSTGVPGPGRPPLPGVEVVLDGKQHVRTAANGTYRFSRVVMGRHKITVAFRSDRPYFFSTQSEMDVAENSDVNFGIGYALSSLTGRLVNDAGVGVGPVTLQVHGKDVDRKVTSDSQGTFMLSQVAEGIYQVAVDEDTLPPGYSSSGLEEEKVTVGASSPGRVVFKVRALRSVTGQVLTYNTVAGRYVPVSGVQVTVPEAELSRSTDPNGRYIFRDLAPGSYTVSVKTAARTYTKVVKVGADPTALVGIDFQIDNGAVASESKQ